jgi:hypothetical protein
MGHAASFEAQEYAHVGAVRGDVVFVHGEALGIKVGHARNLPTGRMKGPFQFPPTVRSIADEQGRTSAYRP